MRSPIRIIVLSALGWLATIVVLSTSAVPVRAQAGSKLWDGIYTDAQADRGDAAFKARTCGSCHNVDLSGGEGPTLKGRTFLSHWENGSLNDLWLKVRNQMPPGVLPGDIPDAVKVDILAFLLRANGFPSGPAELTVNTNTFEDILVLQKGVTAPEVRNFALVQVVGCLSQGANLAWTLTNTSAPVVTRDERPTPVTLAQSRAQALGAGTYTLLSVIPAFRAEALKGQRVEARGLVYIAPNDNRLNLTSLETLDSRCTE